MEYYLFTLSFLLIRRHRLKDALRVFQDSEYTYANSACEKWK